MRNGQKFFLRSSAGVCLLAASIAAPSLSFAQNRPADVRALSELRPDDVTGQRLYDSAGESVSRIVGVKTSADGKIEALELDLGGLFGLGGKHIVVPARDIQLRNGNIQAFSLTSEQIRNLPQQPASQASGTAAKIEQKASDAVQSVKETASDAKQAVSEGAQKVRDKAADAVQSVKEGASNAKQAVTEGAQNVRDKAADAAQSVKEGASDARQAASEGAQNVRDRAADATQNATQQARQAQASGAAATRNFSELRENDVLGATLYDRDGNAVANIRSVRAGPDGRIRFVEIERGGFLGLGAQRVAIPIDRLQYRGAKVYTPALTFDEILALPEANPNN